MGIRVWAVISVIIVHMRALVPLNERGWAGFRHNRLNIKSKIYPRTPSPTPQKKT